MKTTTVALRFAAGLAALSTLAVSLSAVTPPGTPRSERPDLGRTMDPARVNLIESAHASDPVQVVKLKFTVTAAGVPRGIEVVSSSGRESIDRECVTAVKQMRFVPKTVDGVAVAREETMVMVPRTES